MGVVLFLLSPEGMSFLLELRSVRLLCVCQFIFGVFCYVYASSEGGYQQRDTY